MMKRLTTKMESGKNIVIGNKQEAIDRLADYEDTGLEPDKIKEADDFLKENYSVPLARLVEAYELLKEKDEGRLVVLEKKEHQADVLQYYKHYRDRLERYEQALKGGDDSGDRSN